MSSSKNSVIVISSPSELFESYNRQITAARVEHTVTVDGVTPERVASSLYFIPRSRQMFFIRLTIASFICIS